MMNIINNIFHSLAFTIKVLKAFGGILKITLQNESELRHNCTCVDLQLKHTGLSRKAKKEKNSVLFPKKSVLLFESSRLRGLKSNFCKAIISAKTSSQLTSS